jgi:hypothetical protein
VNRDRFRIFALFVLGLAVAVDLAILFAVGRGPGHSAALLHVVIDTMFVSIGIATLLYVRPGRSYSPLRQYLPGLIFCGVGIGVGVYAVATGLNRANALFVLLGLGMLASGSYMLPRIVGEIRRQSRGKQ